MNTRDRTTPIAGGSFFCYRSIRVLFTTSVSRIIKVRFMSRCNARNYSISERRVTTVKKFFLGLLLLSGIGLVYYSLNPSNTGEVQGVILSLSELDLRFADEKQGEYSISIGDFDFSEEELKIGDKIIVVYEGGIMETFPAQFEKVVRIRK